RDGGEADRRVREGGGGSAREGEEPPGRDLKRPPLRPVRDEFDDPLSDPLVQNDASAHELDEDRDPDPDERSGEDVGRPMEAEVDAAQTDEDRERDSRGSGPPSESQG